MEKDEKTEIVEKTYSEAEHKGVIKDLQSERERRQQSGFELSQTQSRIAALVKENETLKNKSIEAESKKSVITGEDDEGLTKGEGRDIESKVMASVKKAQDIVAAKAEKSRLDANFKKTCAAAEQKYLKRKDVGLDWRTVYQAGIKRIGSNQHKELAIYNSDNPGEELYEEGLKDPEIKEKLKLLENDKILDTVGNRKVEKKGLTGETKNLGFHFYTADEVAAMKPAEAQKHLSDINKSALKW